MASRVYIHLSEAKNLKKADLNGKSDPYVKFSVANNKKAKAKSRVIKEDLNPKLDQHLTLNMVDVSNSSANTLSIEVYDYDRFTADDLLGTASVSLSSFKHGIESTNWYKLDTQGEVQIAIKLMRAVDENSAKKYRQMIESDCKKGSKMFEDEDFPANDTSLYKNPPGAHSEIVEWKRMKDIAPSPKLFVDGVESGDVLQGMLGDCYFLGALSTIATRKDLLLPLFTYKNPELGIYQIKFFKNGEWNYVTIDDRLPFNKRSNKLLYSRCADVNEFWVPLVEKAYAKLHGCYEVLASGTISVAMTDLTSESCSDFDFTEPDVQSLLGSGEMWKKMMYFIKENYLLGCSFNSDAEAEAEASFGLLQNHAYGILKAVEVEGLKLVCIRNPWGCKEWTGRFSDKDEKSWTPSLKKKLNFVDENDGTFWMLWEDFIKHYNSMIVLRLLQDKKGHVYSRYFESGEWSGPMRGGCVNNVTWHQNPQFGFETSKKNSLFISLCQPDCRMQWKTNYPLGIGFYLFNTEDHTRRKVVYSSADLYAKASFAPNREVTIDLDDVKPGKYVLIPCSFNQGQESPFYLTVYAEHKLSSWARIPDEQYHTVKGEWKGSSAGGCTNTEKWLKNPTYVVKLKSASKPTPVTVLLRQEERQSLYYVSIYNGIWKGSSLGVSDIVTKPDNTNLKEIAINITLNPNEEQFLIPNTFDPMEEGSFELFVVSPAEVEIKQA